jgi:hypothetical protein
MKKYFLVLSNGECVNVFAQKTLPYELIANALTNNMPKETVAADAFLVDFGVDILDPDTSFQFN